MERIGKEKSSGIDHTQMALAIEATASVPGSRVRWRSRSHARKSSIEPNASSSVQMMTPSISTRSGSRNLERASRDSCELGIQPTPQDPAITMIDANRPWAMAMSGAFSPPPVSRPSKGMREPRWRNASRARVVPAKRRPS